MPLVWWGVFDILLESCYGGEVMRRNSQSVYQCVMRLANALSLVSSLLNTNDTTVRISSPRDTLYGGKEDNT